MIWDSAPAPEGRYGVQVGLFRRHGETRTDVPFQVILSRHGEIVAQRDAKIGAERTMQPSCPSICRCRTRRRRPPGPRRALIAHPPPLPRIRHTRYAPSDVRRTRHLRPHDPLVPHSGVQFVEYAFHIDTVGRLSRRFIEREVVGATQADGRRTYRLLPAWNEEDPGADPVESARARIASTRSARGGARSLPREVDAGPDAAGQVRDRRRRGTRPRGRPTGRGSASSRSPTGRPIARSATG